MENLYVYKLYIKFKQFDKQMYKIESDNNKNGDSRNDYD